MVGLLVQCVRSVHLYVPPTDSKSDANDDAVIKLLWLAIRDIEAKRAAERAREAGQPRSQRKAPGRLVEGGIVQRWHQSLDALTIAFSDRLTKYL